MAIEAPLSRYKKQNMLIIIAILIGGAGWLAYDGYKKEDFIKKHTIEGKPDSTLIFHQKAPPFLIAGAIGYAIYFFLVRNKKLVASENELDTGKIKIPYDAIEKINKTHFDKKGFFTITYSENGQAKELWWRTVPTRRRASAAGFVAA